MAGQSARFFLSFRLSPCLSLCQSLCFSVCLFLGLCRHRLVALSKLFWGIVIELCSDSLQVCGCGDSLGSSLVWVRLSIVQHFSLLAAFHFQSSLSNLSSSTSFQVFKWFVSSHTLSVNLRGLCGSVRPSVRLSVRLPPSNQWHLIKWR